MRTEKDVEAYLSLQHRRYRAVEGQPGTYLIEAGTDQPLVALRVDPPLVVVRVRIGELKSVTNPAPLFRRLLELNAGQLVHASYGLEDGNVVLSSALELENLDFNELQATLDEIDLALATQLPDLSSLLNLAPSVASSVSRT